MILVVVSNAALKGIPFILLPPPTNKSKHPLKGGVLCQNFAVVLVSTKQSQRVPSSDENSSEELLLLYP